ncbi:MAG: hypothetical protein BGO05_05475 [Rhizobiales bacterium 63-7]|nr:MAG: hypothetical protein BGO05_05475 [Rhizobiales bacterium 63-7]
MDVINFSQAEIIAPDDLTAISVSARDAFDARDSGALGWPAHWAHVTVSQASADIVNLTSGEYYAGTEVYGAKETQQANLQSFKPVVASDERWVALILRGSEDLVSSMRPFETSGEPLTESIPVNQSTPKATRRNMSVIVQTGSIMVAPAARPAINENDCCVAFVRLRNTGIAEIVPNEAARVKTVYEIEQRLTTVELSIGVVVELTQSLQTDVANLAAKFDEIPDAQLFRQITRDVSIARQLLNFPDEARNYYYDNGLLRNAFWDFTYAGADFRINEGIRFPYQIQQENVLRVLNPAATDISFWENTLLLPAYTERLRIENPQGKLKKDISNTVHTVKTAVQHTVSNTRLRYGETVTVCENAAGWGQVGSQKANEIFNTNGATWVSKGQTDNPWNNDPRSEGGHKEYAVQRVIKDSYTSTYTSYRVEEFGLSGAVYAQTFVCSQVMVATSIELYFTRVGSEGDVLLCIAEVGPTGAPTFEKVIVQVNKPQGQLAVNQWNKFTFRPTLLEQGKRYAFFTVTTGNHQVAASDDNAFQGGTMFLCTDGIWAQGDVKQDISFRLYAARFAASRTVVPMENLQLTGGMSELEMIYQGWAPDFTSLVWEVKPEGASDWVPMDARVPNPLSTLPANVQLRAVFLGTEDVAPSIIMNTEAITRTGRMKNNQKAISKAMALGFSTDEFQIVMNVDAYDKLTHSFGVKLIVAGVEVAPLSVNETVDPIKPTRSTIIANFHLGAPTTSVRALVNGNTPSVINVPFIQDFQLNAF